MLFEFVPTADFNFLVQFGEKFNLPIHGNRLTFPSSMGEGSIRYFNFDGEFKLLIHHYKLKEEFILKRVGTDEAKGLISFIFYCNDEAAASTTSGTNHFPVSKNSDFAIQIGSRDLQSLTRFAANAAIYHIVIGISATRLKTMLQLNHPDHHPNAIIEPIISGAPGLLIHERMGADVQKVLKQVTESNDEDELSDFYQLIRTQELLYLVFEKLLKRETIRHNPLSKMDIEKLYLIRTAVLSDLSKPPHLKALSKMAGMSETKMKHLFRQVFGNSIYSYFQETRMGEAAFMLKHSGKSVSEVGYQLGFSNLSHFSRVFEKRYGLTPKKYSTGA